MWTKKTIFFFAFTFAMMSTSAFANGPLTPSDKVAICQINSIYGSDESGSNCSFHYQLSTTFEVVKTIRFLETVVDGHFQCLHNTKKAKDALSKLQELAQQLISVGACKILVINIDD